MEATWGLLSMLSWGVADYLARQSSGRIGSLSTALLVQVMGLAVPAAYLAAWPLTIPQPIDWRLLAYLVPVAGLFLGAGYGCFYTGLSKGSVSIVAAIASVWLLVTLALTVLFLGLSLRIPEALLIVAIVAGVVLLSIGGTTAGRGSTGVAWGLLAMLSTGAAFAAWGPITEAGGPALAVLLVRVASGLGFWAFMQMARLPVVLPRDSLGWRLLLATALLDALAFVTYNVGLERASLTLTAPLAAAHPLVTTLLAQVHLRERLSGRQYVGILLTVGSVVALSGRVGV